MKDSKAIHHLSEICETYGKQASELKALRAKVRNLTRQRDQANARNAELRQHLAKYQEQLAQANRARPRATESAWDRSMPYAGAAA